ncbi:craniofacial development protein 2-like [Aphis craccivora]|uniref:Craniofacial development protein 2-like n=1 Tax=Aphis craccivora TaxID=307492 RepID=A0A6G0ZKE2_APHCR|nr:craniofacial development protein 2-like [Aphis craccivora]
MNSRGQKLVEFCEHYELIISSTVYKVLNRRKYIWEAPDDNIRRLQIDYFLVKQNYRHQIKSNSDHSLVMVKCEIKFKKIISKDAITPEQFSRE